MSTSRPLDERPDDARPDTDDEASQAREAKRVMLDAAFCAYVPHNRALGMRFVAWGRGEAELLLPHDERLVGDPETGALHGGVITALLDATSGASVFLATRSPQPIATLDLRVDHLRPSAAGRPLTARATCYRLTRNVAFTRAVAYHDDPDDPVATSAGTFMLGTRGAAAIDLRGEGAQGEQTRSDEGST